MGKYFLYLFFSVLFVLVAAVSVVLVQVIFKPSVRRRKKYLVLLRIYISISIPFLVLSYSIGFLSGISNQPNISAIIPAVLSFLGAIFALIAVKRPSAAMPLGFSVSVFSVAIIYALGVGAQLRESTKLDRLKYLSQQEKKIRLWRHNRDLPEDFPIWILDAEGK